VSGLSPIAAARGGQVAIDGASDIEFAGECVEGGGCAMRLRAQAQKLSGLKAGEQVVGLAQMGEDDDAGLAVDANGLDDAPVAVASNAHALDASHIVSIYILKRLVNRCGIVKITAYFIGTRVGGLLENQEISFLLLVYTNRPQQRGAAYEGKSSKKIAVTTLQR
jgi:hypothetical protein